MPETLIIIDSDRIIDLKGGFINSNILIKGPIKNVKICNGTVKGEIRLRPINVDANKEPNYTELIRESSPSNIELENLTIDTNGSTHQVYFGVGSNNSKIINCKFKGKSSGPCLYLSAEGGNHTIKNNVFNSLPGGRREVLSVDGNSYNTIEDNEFKKCIWGGIFVYRNCGEKGTIRHQKPRHNKISKNKFDLTGMVPVRFSNGSGHQGSLIFIPYGIILGSRQGDSSYCDLDDDYDLGSGKSDYDFARYNIVMDNKFKGDWFKRHILNNDKFNVIANNE